MGCDIHCFVEYQYKGDNYWNNFGGEIDPGRNYEHFGNLAGVRGGDAIVDPRGMPKDPAEETKRGYLTEHGMPCDYWHTPSWLTPTEWDKAISANEYGAGAEYTAMLAAMYALEQWGCNVRVVFWFDN